MSKINPQYITCYIGSETLTDHSNFLFQPDAIAKTTHYTSNYDDFVSHPITWNKYDKYSFSIAYFRANTQIANI